MALLMIHRSGMANATPAISFLLPMSSHAMLYRFSIILASSLGLLSMRGRKDEGRSGTHCMRMRHHSLDFRESDYAVWIYCLYIYYLEFSCNKYCHLIGQCRASNLLSVLQVH